ncbi:hypothetical protein A6770_00320 [Nostoc minutum NIES-26]|uniref:SLH domain-containing protein n=1 Tax=Nostoc minutum NIES-26 TaxID=1844469 RepID=A0A367QXF5_9NOSO|nr:hypothetical protein A6770_00320 [Nostoc minutum NIES-26]
MLPSQKSILKQLTPALLVATLATTSVNNSNNQGRVALAETTSGSQENIVFPKSAVVAQSKFTDIGGNWSRSCITELASQGIISGYPDGTFRPNASVTRAEFAAIISKAFPNAQKERNSIKFVDVPKSYWAYTAIETASQTKFLSGYPGQVFNPRQNIPRAQVLVALAQGLNYSPTQSATAILNGSFTDASSIPAYAESGIAAATEKRLVVNYPDVKYLKPNQSASRAEVSAFLCQALAGGKTSSVPQQYIAGVSSSTPLSPPSGTSTENIVFPKGAAVIDVTATAYGAKPNDGKDDTQAIQKALTRYPSGGRIIYLPNGVYNISDSLHWPPGNVSASDYKRTILQGQSRNGVIIQLKDKSAKFQNSSKPRPVISTGFDPDLDPNSKEFKASLVAQRFGNSIRNLTINTGKNNPGAEGLNFVANNYGATRNVKIISADGKGTTGLALTHGEVGPMLIEDVEVVGFDYGVRTNSAINSVTMQNITVRQQNKAGIFNRGQVISLDSFSSVNSVPAIINGNTCQGIDVGSTLTLLNANISGSGDAKNVSAISSCGFIYARNVLAKGYKNILTSNARGAVNKLSGNNIIEYTSHRTISEFPSPSESLQLPIKRVPKLAWDDPKTWANVRQFGAKSNDNKDDTAAFQAAIDSGATTVVVPRNGEFTINGSLRLRGKVRRFMGTQGWINGTGEIVADNGSQPTLIIQDFSIRYPKSSLKWKSIANRTVVFRDIEHLNLESSGTGDLFIEDAVMAGVKFLNPKQSIWARQINPENPSVTGIVNKGAKLWILGLKTEEVGSTKIETSNGGFTELLGGHVYANGKQRRNPLFRIINASASFAGVAEANFAGQGFQTWVEETRGNQTKELIRANVPNRVSANGRVLVLYAGYK